MEPVIVERLVLQTGNSLEFVCFRKEKIDWYYLYEFYLSKEFGF
jgi:hypothetical protein